MIKVLENKPCHCTKCNSYLGYDNEDVLTGEYVYFVYGCESRICKYSYLVCPICGEKVIISEEE